jgi:hypothetical protein
MSNVSKRDLFGFSKTQADAGRAMWARSGKQGRLANSSMDAEATAPKTWIAWYGAAKGLPEAIIECEIYVNQRASDSREMVGMLHGMCPKCGETFIVREDNKGMSLDWVRYEKSRGHLKEQWERHCRETLRRMPRSEDKIAIVSSPERWQCDYCKEWCVKVTDSVAITDTTGATMLYVTGSTPTRKDEGKVVTATAAAPKTSEILL